MKNSVISLRAVEPEDLETLYKWENDAALWHLGETIKPYSRYELKKYIENSCLDMGISRQQRFMTVENETGRTVGAVDLFDYDPVHRRAGVGILIYGAGDRGKGYGTAAIQLLTDHCRNILGLHTLYCDILSTNGKAKKIFTKNGFEICGVKKEWRLVKGEWVDEEMYMKMLY